MNFIYNMTTEKYGETTVENTGDYQGPSTVNININSDGLMDFDGETEVELSSSNTNHIVFMDILDGSQWFDFDNTPLTTENVGPFINLKKETELAPKSVFDERKSIITPEGVITYAAMEPPFTKDEVISQAENVKIDTIATKDNTTNTTLIEKCDKMLAILDWIIYDSVGVPGQKIVLPTLDSLDDFNNPV